MPKPTNIKESPSTSSKGQSNSTAKRRKANDGYDSEDSSSTNKKLAKKKPKAELSDVYNGKLKEEETDHRAGRADSTTSVSNQPVNVMPKEMFRFCKSLIDLDGEKKLNLSTRKASTKLHQLLWNSPDFNGNEGTDLSAFQSSFTHYYRWATAMSEVSMSNGLKIVMDYVQSPDIIQRHPEYPKRPASTYTKFVQLLGLSMFQSNGKVLEEFKNKKNPRVLKAEEERQRDKERHLNKLREFLANHQDELFQPQINFLQKEIKNAQKLTEKALKKDKPPVVDQKPQKKQPQSAFDLYKKSKEQKYTHLPPEEREAKLQRHFEKLSDEQREIYESIAASLQ